jgi:peptide deformylase
VIFNPEIIKKVGKTTYDEGCLSVPTYYETVQRSELIIVQGLNLDGKKFQLEVDGLLAICIQHEIDHLDGKLFIDRLSPIKSARIKSRIKKAGYPPRQEKVEEQDEEVVYR